MKKNITLFILQMVFVLNLNAQVSTGIRAGVNFSGYQKSVLLDSSDTGIWADLHAGISLDIWLRKKLSLQTGLFYSGGGQTFKREKAQVFPYANIIDTVVSGISGNFQTALVKMPVLFTFDSDGQPGMGKDDGIFDGFRIEAGLYIAHRVRSKLTTKTGYTVIGYDSVGVSAVITSFDETVQASLHNSKNHLNPFDAGIQFGFGIEKSIGFGTLLLNFNFSFGLLDLYRFDSHTKPLNYKPVRYKDWGISLTYFFPSFNKKQS